MVCGGGGWKGAGVGPSPPHSATPVRSQIDSFELLYYYDEYLGHCMW